MLTLQPMGLESIWPPAQMMLHIWPGGGIPGSIMKMLGAATSLNILGIVVSRFFTTRRTWVNGSNSGIAKIKKVCGGSGMELILCTKPLENMSKCTDCELGHGCSCSDLPI